MASLWQGEGAWVALGVSAVFIVVGLVMHRIFINILKNGSQESTQHD
jgi:hypothetical protein